MDQTTQDSFSKTVFNEMFLLHMTCPFCIPFYLAAGKAKLLASTSIWPPANAMDVMWTVIPLFIYVNIALFVSWLQPEVIYHDRFVATNMGVSEIVYLPLGALMVHRAMIALTLRKYSGLSQVEYQRWADAPVPIAKRLLACTWLPTWSRQIQLLSTWLPLPDHVLLMEIQKSCRIQGSEVVYCCVTSGLLCYLHILLAGLFAVMAIVHYKRMHLVLESVCRLTRPLFCMWPNLPQVSLRLGGRYQSRVEAYVATLALAAILGMGLVLVGVVVGVHNQMNSITVVVLSLVAGFTVIMFRTIYFGSKAEHRIPQLVAQQMNPVNRCDGRELKLPGKALGHCR
eukprot:Skav215764  [mRNA]  locus=scaffold106:372677:378055:- [translate_table: standard]